MAEAITTSPTTPTTAQAPEQSAEALKAAVTELLKAGREADALDMMRKYYRNRYPGMPEPQIDQYSTAWIRDVKSSIAAPTAPVAPTAPTPPVGAAPPVAPTRPTVPGGGTVPVPVARPTPAPNPVGLGPATAPLPTSVSQFYQTVPEEAAFRDYLRNAVPGYAGLNPTIREIYEERQPLASIGYRFSPESVATTAEGLPAGSFREFLQKGGANEFNPTLAESKFSQLAGYSPSSENALQANLAAEYGVGEGLTPAEAEAGRRRLVGDYASLLRQHVQPMFRQNMATAFRAWLESQQLSPNAPTFAQVLAGRRGAGLYNFGPAVT